ncbi:MAG TPA: epoxide hydrolase [Solirubrobacterales bacterium]
MSAPGVEPFEPAVDDEVVADLRARLGRTRWPDQPGGIGWELGVDLGYLRALCEHWAAGYDFGRLGRALGGYENGRWNGVHFARAIGEGGGGRLPIMLVHGWPGGVIEFTKLIPLLTAAGHDVIAPSLPGYGYSDELDPPPNAARVAALLGDLMAELGYERYALQGGDWGSPITFQLAFQRPERVAALHLNAVSVLPAPADLSDPPLSEAEQRFVETGLGWRATQGYHLLLQGAAPDAVSAAFTDSPAGLAGWLVEKYRKWSDCDGDVETRFSKDELCDFLTLYWATGTIASSMRLYWGEARDRSRLPAGEKVTVPAGAADFPAEIVRAPRDWAERQLADLRRFTEMPRGGHFAAFEEPELLADDVLALLESLR